MTKRLMQAALTLASGLIGPPPSRMVPWKGRAQPRRHVPARLARLYRRDALDPNRNRRAEFRVSCSVRNPGDPTYRNTRQLVRLQARKAAKAQRRLIEKKVVRS